ncbi:hypothetical protein J7382_17415 [Shimia sp. R11_0]|uniref:hypothetical protein n=1 Tax=Shimia sp. R11_0 TaxID=2821096 RepID=UPI001AD97459|nr:hypothetical protein [Shimia sp. R11_0]MBO9479327.1 hypothetical protein [Shimia sp. R11_0]
MVADMSPQMAHDIGCELRAHLDVDRFSGILPCSSEDALQFLAEWRIHSREDALELTSLPRQAWGNFIEEMTLEQQFWTIAVAAQLAFEAAATLRQIDADSNSAVPSVGIVKRMQALLHAAHIDPEAQWPFPTPRPQF